jgi:hypothetical protein
MTEREYNPYADTFCPCCGAAEPDWNGSNADAEYHERDAQIDRLTRELAQAQAEAERMRGYNTGLDKITTDLERRAQNAEETILEQFKKIERLQKALKDLFLLACVSQDIRADAPQMKAAGKLLAVFEQGARGDK